MLALGVPSEAADRGVWGPELSSRCANLTDACDAEPAAFLGFVVLDGRRMPAGMRVRSIVLDLLDLAARIQEWHQRWQSLIPAARAMLAYSSQPWSRRSVTAIG